ncbi:ribosome biogenesis GTPase Der [Candidatus Poriferisodalis sp.]|uniref:ribosome biogenesis GTPase Der n=1 Tax=Candidatus Poriferisodalis sp. TaxID=3101277 RepID=UPI003B0274B2
MNDSVVARESVQGAPDAGGPLGNALPTVGIVGRPNVGKSTLFNRLVGRREAVVAPQPGVTRDRKAAEAAWRGHAFNVIDTGGWSQSGDALDDMVSEQSERAMADADVLLLVVDVTVGITEPDARIASLLRRSGRPTLVVANKADSGARDHGVWEFSRLGLGEPWAASALHGRNVGDLLDRVIELLETAGGMSIRDDGVQLESAPSLEPAPDPESPDPDPDESIPSVAIVGRPNVGKSTLFNRLIGDERAVVHDRPGTTRDTIDTLVETDAGPVRFVDTAGMRRKARVDTDTEYYANLRALRAIDACDVVMLVVDATEGVTTQDQRLAERIDAAGCPIVVLLNKWETVDTEHREMVLADLARRLHFVGESPVLRISALTGRGVHRLVPAIDAAMEAYESRAPTSKVNDIIKRAQSAQPAPGGARVLYATQVATQPPTFTLFANREMPATYLRYLERRLREELGLAKTPLKLRVRRR